MKTILVGDRALPFAVAEENYDRVINDLNEVEMPWEVIDMYEEGTPIIRRSADIVKYFMCQEYLRQANLVCSK